MKVKFKEIANFTAGQSPESKYYSETNGTPFLQGNRTFGERYPLIDTYTTKITKEAKKDEILMSVRAPVGDLNFAPCDLCIGRGLASISSKEGNNDFLYYVLKYNVQSLIKQGSGTTYDSVSKDIVENWDLIIPCDKESWTKIAACLKNIDAKIANNNAICAELEAMAKLLYDYWFVQFDFPDENGRPYKSSGGKMVWNEELKREIPEGWSIAEMGSVFEITMGSSPRGESLNENENGTEFYQGSTDFGRFYPTERVYTTSPVRFAKKQDVLMSVRAPVGDMNFALNDCCIGRGLAAIRHKSPLYAWNTLRTFQPYFDMFNGAGTTFGALTSDDLKKKWAVVPAADVLNAYCNQVASIEFALRNNECENRQLESLRDFLLPMLMNGQVSFKEVC